MCSACPGHPHGAFATLGCMCASILTCWSSCSIIDVLSHGAHGQSVKLLSGVLKKQKEEHEQYKKGTINTDKVELQKHEAVERYPQ